MQLLCRLLLILLFPVWAFGQGKENAVDRIKTAEDLKAFVKEQELNAKYRPWQELPTLDPVWAFSGLTLKDNSDAAGIRKLLKKTKSSPWLKGDYNGDGYTDLIITDKSLKLIVGFISKEGSENFTINPVSTSYFCDLVFVFPARFGDRDGLQLHLYNIFGQDLFKEKRKLIYSYGAFMDYNPRPDTLKVVSLFVETTPCYGTCPEYEMTFDTSGKLTYYFKGSGIVPYDISKYTGHFTYQVGKDSAKFLSDMLNYISFRCLKDSYGVSMSFRRGKYIYQRSVSDQPSINLKVTFANGEVKSISDYGWKGTQSLEALYALFEEWRQRLRWVKVK